MKKYEIILILLLAYTHIIVCCSFSQTRNNDSFYRYFTAADTISFDIDSLLIGDIAGIIALSDGRFVVNDQISMSAIWVDLKNRRYKYLNEHKDLPGVNFYPLALCKDQDDGFWEAIPSHYLKYDSNGNLAGKHTDRKFTVSDQFCVDSESNLYIYSNQPSLNGAHVLRFGKDAYTIEKLFKIGFSGNLYNIIYRFTGGGIIIDSESNLYCANAVENKILKYDIKGNLIQVCKSKNVPFKGIKKDIKPGTEGVMEFLQSYHGNNHITTIHNIGFIDDEYFYVQYFDGQFKYVEILNKNGVVLNKRSLIIPDKTTIIGAADGFVYAKVSMSKEMTNLAVNPKVIKYTFNPEGRD